MGYYAEDGDVELAVLPRFADGALGGASGAEGIGITRTADGAPVGVATDWRPEADVVGWTVTADRFDSRGRRYDTTVLAEWTRVYPPQIDDLPAGRVAAVGAEVHLEARDDVEQAVRALWDAHTAPQRAQDTLRDAVAARAAAETAVDHAVATARATGHSWADIGRLTGMTRQSARQRWGRDTDAATIDQVVGRIHVAYNSISGGPGNWVSLRHIRSELLDVPRADLDTALRHLADQAGVMLNPDPGSLTSADRSATVHVNGQAQHLIAIDRP